MRKLGDVAVVVLRNAWTARAAALKTVRQEEKTPLAERRAQDEFAGDRGPRLHKVAE